MKSCIAALIFFMLTSSLVAQKIEIISEKDSVSFRGLSVVTDKVVWVSGSKGTVGRSIDGGKTFTWNRVKGFETRDFRDIEAFNENTAVIIAVAEPAYILRTTDGGKNWTTVYENKTKGMFLDAMDFFNDTHGTAIGDPIDGKLFVVNTTDGGRTWKPAPENVTPKLDSGEACFASSGTNIRKLTTEHHVVITGGLNSRVFYNAKPNDVLIVRGSPSKGGNSIATSIVGNKPVWVVVGGDFTNDKIREGNCSVTRDFGTTWLVPPTPPFGYRSCVEFIGVNALITCGTNGVDISADGGMNWKNISTTGFHVARKAKKGSAVFLAGGKGRVGKYVP